MGRDVSTAAPTPSDRKYESRYVRAVRGGGQSGGYMDHGNGTVTDTSTGLMWQKVRSFQLP